MSRLARCVLAFLVLVSGAAQAADLVPAAQKKLDAYFDLLQQQGLASGSIAISERGVRRYTRSIGFATIENGAPQPADEGTRYRIGPVSHMFIATLMMQLAESATITLDNKVAEFFPDFPNALETSYRDLMREHGGPADDANYLLLVRVLEKVRERPFDEILQLGITRKLGLARTYVEGSGMASTLESLSYEWHEGWKAAAPGAAASAGAMMSNAGDLAAFMDALFASRVVTVYNLGNMSEQQIGMRSLDLAGRHCVGERGRVAAFDTYVCHFPEARISIAWTGNAARLPVDRILDEAARLVFERGRRPPKAITAE
jgi:D-alanyl-D-alanine carboxypeptidase